MGKKNEKTLRGQVAVLTFVLAGFVAGCSAPWRKPGHYSAQRQNQRHVRIPSGHGRVQLLLFRTGRSARCDSGGKQKIHASIQPVEARGPDIRATGPVDRYDDRPSRLLHTNLRRRGTRSRRRTHRHMVFPLELDDSAAGRRQRSDHSYAFGGTLLSENGRHLSGQEGVVTGVAHRPQPNSSPGFAAAHPKRPPG